MGVNRISPEKTKKVSGLKTDTKRIPISKGRQNSERK